MKIAIATLIILILSLFVQYKRYGLKLILHPSSYFLLMWILSILSFLALETAGFSLIYYDAYLNELMIFVSFTSLCFIFVGFRSSIPIKRKPVKLNLFIPEKIFRIFVIIFFISSIVNLFQTGFNVAENRRLTNEMVFQMNERGIIGLITGVISMLGLPFIVYSGWKVGKLYMKKKSKIDYIYFLPLITGFVDTFRSGGRSGIVSTMILFLLGFFLTFFSYNYISYKDRFFPLLKYFVVFFLLFSSYSTFVSISRSSDDSVGSNDKTEIVSLFEYSYPNLKIFSGLAEYFVFHYQGYQWRRDDSSSDKLEWGQNTFAFITNFNIPVLSQLSGQNISIKEIFNLKDTDPVKLTIKNFEEDKIGASITATVYYVLFQDFGFYGTLIMIFLFVFFSQMIFEKLFQKENRGFFSIIIYLAVYRLWMQTFFHHHLAGAWFNSYLYPILIIELLNLWYKKKYTVHYLKGVILNSIK